VQLRRTAGEVESADTPRRQHLGDQVQGCGIHHFGAVGTGIDMAVQAALVALVTEIDLQGLSSPAPDGGEIGNLKQRQGIAHGPSWSDQAMSEEGPIVAGIDWRISILIAPFGL